MALHILNSGLTEIRFLGRQRFGLFTDDPAIVAEACACPCVRDLDAYQLLNPPKADTPDRKQAPRNTLFRATQGQLTADADISYLENLLLDSDVIKPVGTAASEEQRQAARAHSDKLASVLTSEGWPEMFAADSGNGFHRIIRIHLPNNPESHFLLSNFLHLAARKFDESRIKLDKSVSNPARVTRLYGMPNRKAKRNSAVICLGDTRLVTEEQIRGLVSKWRGSLGYKKHMETRRGGWTPERMEALLDFHNIGYLGPVHKTQGLLWVLSPCPFNSDHSGSSPAVMITKQGWPKFKCLHNSCQGKGWKAFLAHLNITSGKVFPWKSWNCENKSARS